MFRDDTSTRTVAQSTSGLFHFHRPVFSSQIKGKKIGNLLCKTTVLRITLNLDGTPITSKSHTHTSRVDSSS